MSYQYEPTKAERRAAELLRRKGWRVDEPSCPECHGFGFTTVSKSWGEGAFGGGSISTRDCSNGCARASMFFPAWPTVPQSGTVVHDDWPPCTCPKGNYVGDWICERHNPTPTTWISL